jgi:hypothetical protein
MRFNITSCSAAFVSDIVVPTTISSIVIVAQNDSIFGQGAVPRILNIANSMELLTNLTFDDLILF